MNHALEIVTYKIKGEVSEANYIKASAQMEEHFAKKQKGFIKRVFGKVEGKNEWIDVIHWETMDDALKAADAAMASEACAPMFGMLDMPSVIMSHFEVITETQ